MDIRLLISDLDETLISPQSPIITDRAIKAISQVKEKGIKATIATGRMHSSVLPFAEKLGITEPLISFNGGLIKRMNSEEIIARHLVSYDDAIEVLEFAKDVDNFIQYYSDDTYYAAQQCTESEAYGKEAGIRATIVGQDLTKTLDFDPAKLLMICPDEQKADYIYDFAVRKFKGRLNVTQSKHLYIEFNALKASKGAACEVLAQYYGFNLSNVMSMGNGGNDVSMIKKCGLGVAVGNACPEAKAAADYVSPPQEEEGAIYAVERFLLNR